jgi:phosphatidate phosphatase APP1
MKKNREFGYFSRGSLSKIVLRIKLLICFIMVVLVASAAGTPSKSIEKNLQNSVAETEIMMQQQRQVTGTIKDKGGLPLPGVSVVVQGTTIGTVTDRDGNFTLSVPAEARVL